VVYAELFVIDAGHMAVKVKVLTAVALQNTDESKESIVISKDTADVELKDSPGYTIAWVSPTRKFGVKRDGQKEWIRADFATKDEARKWAISDLKAMAA
jgi:hypothetical protein